MNYGLSGASATGKTTLAKLVADALDITYLPSSITATAQKHGFNAVADLSLDKRMDLQDKLLQDHLELVDAQKGMFITDRTPIDMAGYALAEFGMHSDKNASQEVLARADAYARDCIKAAVSRYDRVFLLSRLMTYEVSDKRPPKNSAYDRHCDLLMKGLLIEATQSGLRYNIVAGQNLHFRETFVTQTIARCIDANEMFRRSRACN